MFRNSRKGKELVVSYTRIRVMNAVWKPMRVVGLWTGLTVCALMKAPTGQIVP